MASWSSLRSQLSSWRTGTQNFSKGLVSPLDQESELLSHPLPMETLDDTTGWQLFGFDLSFLRGGFSKSTDPAPSSTMEIYTQDVPWQPLEDTTGWQLFGHEISFHYGSFHLVNYVLAALGWALREDETGCLREDGGFELEESYHGS